MTGSAVLFRVNPLNTYPQAESDAYSRVLPLSAAASNFLYRQPPTGPSRLYRVTQLRTDGVHCRESASTGPVVLNVVPVTGAAYSGNPVGQILCASRFQHPLLIVVQRTSTIHTKKIGGSTHRVRSQSIPQKIKAFKRHPGRRSYLLKRGVRVTRTIRAYDAQTHCSKGGSIDGCISAIRFRS